MEKEGKFPLASERRAYVGQPSRLSRTSTRCPLFIGRYRCD